MLNFPCLLKVASFILILSETWCSGSLLVTEIEAIHIFSLWWCYAAAHISLIFQRLTLKLACPMDLRNFPMDTQICSVEIESCELQHNVLFFPDASHDLAYCFRWLQLTRHSLPLVWWSEFCQSPKGSVIATTHLSGPQGKSLARKIIIW